MFGGSGLFSSAGGDVNAGAMSFDEESGAGSGAGAGSNMGENYGESGGGSTNIDPASVAAGRASGKADAMTNQTNAMAVAGGIGKSAGFFSAIEGLVGPRAKRLAKRQRVYARHQAQFAYNQSIRARDQYAQDVEVQRQQLSQSYAGRGVGESSIQTEGMKYFNDTAMRKAAQLEENITLAHMGQQVVTSQIAASYSQTWLALGNSVSNMI